MSLAGNDGRVLANVQAAAGDTAGTHAGDKNTPVLMLGALGVVFGDIGTSPIYAFREALHASASDHIVDRPEEAPPVWDVRWARCSYKERF